MDVDARLAHGHFREVACGFTERTAARECSALRCSWPTIQVGSEPCTAESQIVQAAAMVVAARKTEKPPPSR